MFWDFVGFCSNKVCIVLICGVLQEFVDSLGILFFEILVKNVSNVEQVFLIMVCQIKECMGSSIVINNIKVNVNVLFGQGVFNNQFGGCC